MSNLGPRKCELDLASELPDNVCLTEMFADRHYDDDRARRARTRGTRLPMASPRRAMTTAART